MSNEQPRWVRVPEEPTEEMVRAAEKAELRFLAEERRAGRNGDTLGFKAIWREMLAAAPSMSSKYVPPKRNHQVQGLIEAARCLGVAQQANDADAAEHWNAIVDALAKALNAAPSLPGQATCVCGNPLALNTVHRADGPCYQAERDDTGAEAMREALTKLMNAIHQGQLLPRTEAGGYIAAIVEVGEQAIRALPLQAVQEQETEIELLRIVYEQARSFLRFNGTDKDRMNRAVDAMDEAVENVKQFDGGAFEKEAEQPTATNGLSETGWQPIETAPRDGQIIVACLNIADTERTVYPKDTDFWVTIFHAKTLWAAREENAPLWMPMHEARSATHWMPLPVAPVATKQENRS